MNADNDCRPGCECGQVKLSAGGAGRLIVDDPHDAREAPDPEAVRRWYTETLPGVACVIVPPGGEIVISASTDQRGAPAGSLAATPCQMMLGDGPGSPNEHPCGLTPTVGGNRLYRYCGRHLDVVAQAGGTVYRDADQDLQIDDNGDLVVATLASIDRALAEEPPGSVRAIACRALTGTVILQTTGTMSGTFGDPGQRKVIRCERAWPGDGFTAGGSFEVTSGVDLDALATSNVGKIGTLGAAPTPVSSSGMCAGPDTTTGETSIHFYDEGASACRCGERSALAGRRADQFFIDDPHGPPLGKAPQCSHRALTDGCSTCAILSEHLARVGVDRAARILMAEAGTLGPVDADDLRKQFGLPEPPVVHIANYYDPALSDAIVAEFGQKAVLNVLRSNPVQRRAEAAAALAPVPLPLCCGQGMIASSNSEGSCAVCGRVMSGVEMYRENMRQSGHSGVSPPRPDGCSSQEELLRVLVTTKHGPGGSGRRGACDPNCVKCAAERSFSPEKLKLERQAASGTGVSQSPPRPDGFSQSQVDAAKAVLLAPVAKRGGK